MGREVDFVKALTFAADDVKKKWENCKEAFVKEMRRYEN